MKILVSCLSLDGSYSGYRTILRNMILFANEDVRDDCPDYKFLIAKRGLESLNIPKDQLCRVIITRFDFKNKWLRGLYEQWIINYFAYVENVNIIFMPATFGLIAPIKKTVTFVHTNTSFAVEKSLRARSAAQQLAHKILTRITARSSKSLVFTSKSTKIELEQFLGRAVHGSVIGNGIRVAPQNTTAHKFKSLLPHDKPYFLSVSQLYRLKNFEAVISGFIYLKENFSGYRDHLLYIIGTIKEHDYFLELQDLTRGRDDIIFKSGVDDDVLTTMFEFATAYIQLSKFEGYSLTPAQALLKGTPAVISDIVTHREIYRNTPGISLLDIENLAINKNFSQIISSLPSDRASAISVAAEEEFGFNSFMSRLESNFHDV